MCLVFQEEMDGGKKEKIMFTKWWEKVMEGEKIFNHFKGEGDEELKNHCSPIPVEN